MSLFQYRYNIILYRELPVGSSEDTKELDKLVRTTFSSDQSIHKHIAIIVSHYVSQYVQACNDSY